VRGETAAPLTEWDRTTRRRDAGWPPRSNPGRQVVPPGCPSPARDPGQRRHPGVPTRATPGNFAPRARQATTAHRFGTTPCPRAIRHLPYRLPVRPTAERCMGRKAKKRAAPKGGAWRLPSTWPDLHRSGTSEGRRAGGALRSTHIWPGAGGYRGVPSLTRFRVESGSLK
jgi:hypothetical protein